MAEIANGDERFEFEPDTDEPVYLTGPIAKALFNKQDLFSDAAESDRQQDAIQEFKRLMQGRQWLELPDNNGFTHRKYDEEMDRQIKLILGDSDPAGYWDKIFKDEMESLQEAGAINPETDILTVAQQEELAERGKEALRQSDIQSLKDISRNKWHQQEDGSYRLEAEAHSGGLGHIIPSVLRIPSQDLKDSDWKLLYTNTPAEKPSDYKITSSETRHIYSITAGLMNRLKEHLEPDFIMTLEQQLKERKEALELLSKLDWKLTNADYSLPSKYEDGQRNITGRPIITAELPVGITIAGLEEAFDTLNLGPGGTFNGFNGKPYIQLHDADRDFKGYKPREKRASDKDKFGNTVTRQEIVDSALLIRETFAALGKDINTTPPKSFWLGQKIARLLLRVDPLFAEETPTAPKTIKEIKRRAEGFKALLAGEIPQRTAAPAEAPVEPHLAPAALLRTDWAERMGNEKSPEVSQPDAPASQGVAELVAKLTGIAQKGMGRNFKIIPPQDIEELTGGKGNSVIYQRDRDEGHNLLATGNLMVVFGEKIPGKDFLAGEPDKRAALIDGFKDFMKDNGQAVTATYRATKQKITLEDRPDLFMRAVIMGEQLNTPENADRAKEISNMQADFRKFMRGQGYTVSVEGSKEDGAVSFNRIEKLDNYIKSQEQEDKSFAEKATDILRAATGKAGKPSAARGA